MNQIPGGHGTMTQRNGSRSEDAIQRGIAYLAAQQREDGCWQDYLIFGSVADSYVTAFVGSLLAELDVDVEEAMLGPAFDWLLSLPSEMRWGFAPETARDADSTLWVLRLAERLGRLDERLAGGYDFVDRHIGPNGGVCAYSIDDYRERFANETPLPGWFAEHMCVSAGAGGLKKLDARDRVLECLRQHQESDGSWPVYWWLDREYATVFAAEALMDRDGPGDRERALRAAGWVKRRLTDGRVCSPQLPDGSPWLTALALRSLVKTAQERDLASLAVDALLRAQMPDGSWAPSALMRAPYYYEVVPDDSRWLGPQEKSDSFNTLYPDHHRTMTTAMAVNALGLAREFV